MFATKGWMKVTLLVVGILAVVFGMYAAFQPEEAKADHSSLSCLIKDDRIFLSVSTSTGWNYTGRNQIRSSIKCPDCSSLPGGRRHKQKQVITYYSNFISYEHRYLWETTFTFCHTHFTRSSSLSWETVRCGRIAI